MNRKYNSATYGLMIVRVIEQFGDTCFNGEVLHVEQPTELIFVGKIVSGLSTNYWEECPSPTKIEIPLTL